MFGIYIHVPFCLRKCPYCDFFSVPIERDDSIRTGYLRAVLNQLESSEPKGRPVGTIYFGGGTPSLMPPEFFAGLMDAIRSSFDVAADAEVSCEVNPATTSSDWFNGVKSAGVNRISIGVQSFDPDQLKLLGRLHDKDDAMSAIAMAQDAGFSSVNLDLMYGIPGETMGVFEEDMRTAMMFQPDHISAYQLTLEEGTEFAKRFAADFVDDDLVLKQMRAATRMLGRNKWNRYEISNFARAGFECRHNLNYWRYGEYLGLGAGATSFLAAHGPRTTDHGPKTIFGRRVTQVKDINSYIGGCAEPDCEDIDVKTAMGEFCFMGLRTTEGIDTAEFAERFGRDFDDVFGAKCDGLVDEGLASRCDGRQSLTPRGFELYNTVASQMLPSE